MREKRKKQAKKLISNPLFLKKKPKDMKQEEGSENKTKKRITKIRIKNPIQIHSIRGKLIAGYIIPIVLIVLLGAISYRFSSEAIRTNYEESVVNTVDSSGQYLQLGLENVSNQMLQLAFNADVTDYYRGTVTDVTENYENRTNIISTLNSSLVSNEFINSITIFGRSGDLITTLDSSRLTTKDALGDTTYDEFTAQDTIDWLEYSGGIWQGYNTFMDEKAAKNASYYAISFTRRVQGNIGYIIADIQTDVIQAKLDDINIDQDTYTGFLTKDEKLLMAGEESEEASAEETSVETTEVLTLSDSLYQTEFIQSALSSEEVQGNHYVDFDGESYLFIYRQLGETGVILFQLIPEATILKQADHIRTITICIVILAMIISGLIATLIARSINSSIKNIIQPIQLAADGDLTVSINTERKDEFKALNEAISHMLTSMKTLINKAAELGDKVMCSVEVVNDSSEHVLSASKDITKAIEEIQGGVTQQAMDAESCLKEMDILSEKITVVYDNTTQIEEIANTSTNIIQEGKSMVADLNVKTDETTMITKEVIEGILDLETQSKSIGKIIEAINEIADQTNLLSLNASIEAARAGDAGRGFAVVADEIRNLSDQSSESANRIREIILLIESKTKHTVVTAQKAEQIVSLQQKSLHNTVELFEQINEHVSGLVNNLSVIVEGITGIEHAKNDTLQSIESISAVSEETAASSEEVNATAVSQTDSVVDLNEAVESLMQDIQLLEEQIKVFRVE